MNTTALMATESSGLGRSLDPSGLVEEFLASADVKDGSKRAYRIGLQRIFAYCAEREVSRPDREDVLGFRNALRAEGLAVNTANLYLIAVRQFFAFTEGRRVYPNVARGVKGLRGARGHLRDAVTADQLRAMLAAVDRSTLQGKRDYALLNLQARLGLRAIELTRLDIGDIHNGGADTLIAVWGKCRETREDELVLMPAALEPLAEYLAARAADAGRQPEADDPLFCSHSDRNRCERLTTRSVSRIAKQYLHAIGAVSPRLSGHSLRHFFVTCQVEAGVPLQAVMASARHLSVSTTMRYFHEADRLQNAGERFVSF